MCVMSQPNATCTVAGIARRAASANTDKWRCGRSSARICLPIASPSPSLRAAARFVAPFKPSNVSRQNPNDFLDFEGKFWLYRFSRETGRFTEGHETGQGFYTWQFQEQEGKRILRFRKFEGEPFAAAIWTRLEAADITVFRGA